MRRRWRWLATAAGVATATAAVGAGALRAMWYLPGPEERAPVACADDAPALPRGVPLKVLVWNLQFAAGRDQEFFYDGGTAVSVPEHKVRETLDGIAAVIRQVGPDIVLLQEVDRASRRTAMIDEHAELRRLLEMPCHTAAPYHKVPYVPFPSHEHLGKVDMNLSVFSRYRLDIATRYQLPLLKESAVRRWFNLRRAVLRVDMPVEGGGTLRLFDTHLSAFSHNDGTLEEQIAVLLGHGQAAQADGVSWVLAGDLNSLPPGDDPARVGGEGHYAAISAVQPLFDAFASPFPPRDVPALRTYTPFGAPEPDRTLDYLFYGGATVSDLAVIPAADALSDHRPFVVTLTLP